MPVAYSLRAEYSADDATYVGGVLNVPTDRAFDVADALKQGNGTIVVDDNDGALITVLDEYAPLKRVAVPEKAEPVDPYADLSAARLRDEIKTRGLEGVGASKDEMRDALRADDNKTGDGDGND